MFTGLYRQTVTEAEHVKMIEVDSKSRSRLEIFSNLVKTKKVTAGICSKCRVTLHHRESSGAAWGDRFMDLSQDSPGECPEYLRSSYVALCWAQTAGFPLRVAFSDHLACSGIPVARFNTRDHTC